MSISNRLSSVTLRTGSISRRLSNSFLRFRYRLGTLTLRPRSLLRGLSDSLLRLNDTL
jgi:hypothetical protein